MTRFVLVTGCVCAFVISSQSARAQTVNVTGADSTSSVKIDLAKKSVDANFGKQGGQASMQPEQPAVTPQAATQEAQPIKPAADEKPMTEPPAPPKAVDKPAADEKPAVKPLSTSTDKPRNLLKMRHDILAPMTTEQRNTVVAPEKSEFEKDCDFGVADDDCQH